MLAIYFPGKNNHKIFSFSDGSLRREFHTGKERNIPFCRSLKLGMFSEKRVYEGNFPCLSKQRKRNCRVP